MRHGALSAALDAQAARGRDGAPSAGLLSRIGRRNAELQDDGGNPFRKIGGAIELHCVVDPASRRVADAASFASAFRGYETLLLKRDLRDAGLISATASGICGGVHAATSAQCLEMALGIRTPPLAILMRNLLLACQYLNDAVMHLFVLSGPDYAETAIRATNREIWTKASQAPARHATVHGHATIGAILTELERPAGRLFAEALDMMRLARAAYALLAGKYPNSESIVPGGMALELDRERLDAFVAKLTPFKAYAVRTARLWDDVFDFLSACDPGYRDLGRRPANLVDFGQWDDEDSYDGSYARCDEWGERRWSTPGAVIGGELVTTSLAELNCGMEVFVDNSFYDSGRGTAHRSDPLGNPIGAQHPWNQSVRSNPQKEGAYSWAASLVWERNVFEVGCYARLYVSALAKKMRPSARMASTGRSLVFDELEWRVPETWNAFERNRARAYSLAFNLAVLGECHARAQKLLCSGATQLRTALRLPAAGLSLGAGFGGAGRGMLAHWAVLDGAQLDNYQIAIPSRINGAPRSPWGQPGAIEEALLNTRIVEAGFKHPEELLGIDIVRAIQSFDPCMPCKAEIAFTGTNFTQSREVTSDGLI